MANKPSMFDIVLTALGIAMMIVAGLVFFGILHPFPTKSYACKKDNDKNIVICVPIGTK